MWPPHTTVNSGGSRCGPRESSEYFIADLNEGLSSLAPYPFNCCAKADGNQGAHGEFILVNEHALGPIWVMEQEGFLSVSSRNLRTELG